VPEHMSIAAVTNHQAHKAHKALSEEFAEIFRDHYPMIYRTAYSITGSKPDAEDVLQTIFLRLLQRDVPVEFKRSPKAYLYRAAVNLALNTLRSRKSRGGIEDVEQLEAPAHAVDPDASREDEEIQRCLLDAVAQLRPKAVEILILHYEHNYSDAEIAKMLGKSRGTIAVTLYRARARLKKLMVRAQEKGAQQEGKS
jgi:RNA polymerase sigma-70 factor (ECF subfamily)